MKKLAIFVLVFLSVVDARAAQTCEFKEIKMASAPEQKMEMGKYTLMFLEGSGDGVFQTAAVFEGKKKVCELKGGIYSGAATLGKSNLALIVEYSGSCGDHRIVDLSSCKTVGKMANYCGTAKVEGRRLVNHAVCEDSNLCSSAEVWDIGESDCSFKFNLKASNDLTKSDVGTVIPQDAIYEIIDIHTSAAKLGKKQL